MPGAISANEGAGEAFALAAKGATGEVSITPPAAAMAANALRRVGSRRSVLGAPGFILLPSCLPTSGLPKSGLAKSRLPRSDVTYSWADGRQGRVSSSSSPASFHSLTPPGNQTTLSNP